MRALLSVPLIALLAALGACAHAPLVGPNTVEPMEPGAYAKLMRANTLRTDQYSGFYQTFQADVTIMTTEVQNAVLRQQGNFLQWDQRQYQQAREKAVQEANAYAKFFLRFYAPNRDYDDLAKGKTIWKVFLDYSGNRFEGKVTKRMEKLIELQTLFPNMDGFSTAYDVTFNVPMTTLEQGTLKVVLTSGLGQAEFTFPKAK